jgi:hypothetical protein
MASDKPPTSSYAATTKNVYPKPRCRAAPNEKTPAVTSKAGASLWRRGGECSFVQGPIAELHRGDFEAPLAVAAFLAQRIGEVGPERARRVDRGLR